MFHGIISLYRFRWKACIVFTLSLIVYENVRRCDFVFDDHLAVRTNPDVDTIKTPNWTDILRHDFWGKDLRSHESHKSWRPLTTLSFRANHYLSEYRAEAYHVTNAFAHALASVCVLCVGSTFPFDERESVRDRVGFVAALLFAVHPVHTEAVTGVVGRAEILWAMFAMGAFSANALRGRSSIEVAVIQISVMCLLACATLAKDTGITTLGMLVVSDIVALDSSKWIRPHFWPWIRVATKIIFFVAYAFLRSTLMSSGESESPIAGMTLQTSDLIRKTENPFAFTSGMSWYLSTAYLHARYALLLIWPRELCAEYSFNCIPVLETIADPRNVLSIGAYALGAGIVVAGLRYRNRGVLVAMAWVVCPILPASNIFMRVGTLLAERLLYVPSIGFCLLVSYAFVMLTESRDDNDAGSRKRTRKKQLLFAALLVLVLSVMATKTRARTTEWETDKSLFESAIRVCPQSAKMQMMVGQIRFHEGRGEEALQYYERARQIDPEYCDLDLKFGELYASKGDIGRAAFHFREALQCSYVTSRAWDMLQQIWQVYLDVDSQNVTLNIEIGDTLSKMGGKNMLEGITYYREAAVLLLRRGESIASSNKQGASVEADTYYTRSLNILDNISFDRCDISYWKGMVHNARASLDGTTRSDKSRRPRERTAAIRDLQKASTCNDTVAAATDALVGIHSSEADELTRLVNIAQVLDNWIRMNPSAASHYAPTVSTYWSKAADLLFERGTKESSSAVLRRAGDYYANAVASDLLPSCALLFRSAIALMEIEKADLPLEPPATPRGLLHRASAACVGDPALSTRVASALRAAGA